jgi:hypothetical protein
MSPEPMRNWDDFVVSSHLAFVPAVVVARVRFGKGYAWMLMMMSVLAIMIVKMVTMMNSSFSGNSVSGLNSLQMTASARSGGSAMPGASQIAASASQIFTVPFVLGTVYHN